VQQFGSQQWNEEVSLAVSLYSGCYLTLIPVSMSVILMMFFVILRLNECLKYAASVCTESIHFSVHFVLNIWTLDLETSMRMISVRTANFCSYFIDFLYLYACGFRNVLFNPLKSAALTYQNSPLLPTECICVFRMVLAINSDCFPNSINHLIFVAET
jgi:hypothetical protein